MTTVSTAPRSRPSAVVLPAQPYPGLRPFEKQEWPIFFGRDRNTAEIVDRLIEKQFIVLHGDSGCGKSSLVRAGVMPRLEKDHARGGVTWRTTTMLPRNAPLNNLALALAQLQVGTPDPNRVVEFRRLLNLGSASASMLPAMLRKSEHDYICILVDQFEETLELRRIGLSEEAEQFVDVITGFARHKPPGLHLAMTMRSEFIGACAHFRELAEALNEALFLLPRMEKSSIARAIVEPAELFGGAVQAELVLRIIADVGGEQDQLPLIQHAMNLFYRRKMQGLGGGGVGAAQSGSCH